jgi:hypothetical protein
MSWSRSSVASVVDGQPMHAEGEEVAQPQARLSPPERRIDRVVDRAATNLGDLGAGLLRVNPSSLRSNISSEI